MGNLMKRYAEVVVFSAHGWPGPFGCSQQQLKGHCFEVCNLYQRWMHLKDFSSLRCENDCSGLIIITHGSDNGEPETQLLTMSKMDVIAGPKAPIHPALHVFVCGEARRCFSEGG